jgi:death-on-curing protein
VEIHFLTVDEVLAIHADQINRYGGSIDLRDRGLLESAVATPAATFDGQHLHGDIFEMAAAYLFHLVQNHPFVDGNKRTGAVAADVFLALNGFRLTASESEYYAIVVETARGTGRKNNLADFLRKHTEPV